MFAATYPEPTQLRPVAPVGATGQHAAGQPPADPDAATPTWQRIRRMLAFFDAGISPALRPQSDGPAQAHLDSRDLREAIKLLHHHPGAPMALDAVTAEHDDLGRCKAFLRYLGVQRQSPSIDSASSEGSATVWVNPLRLSDYVRGLTEHAGGNDPRELGRLQAIAREQLLEECFAFARKACGRAAIEAAGWAPAEIRRRTAEAPASKGVQPFSRPAAAPVDTQAGMSRDPGYGRPG